MTFVCEGSGCLHHLPPQPPLAIYPTTCAAPTNSLPPASIYLNSSWNQKLSAGDHSPPQGQAAPGGQHDPGPWENGTNSRTRPCPCLPALPCPLPPGPVSHQTGSLGSKLSRLPVHYGLTGGPVPSQRYSVFEGCITGSIRL